MQRPKREYVVVSVGGSLIVPDGIDVSFLKRFRELVNRKVEEGYGFYVIAGGGKIARDWRDAAREVRNDVSNDDLDWVGIGATRLNAELMRAVFAKDTIGSIVLDPSVLIDTDVPLLFGGGFRAGNSSDYAAVTAAKTLGATRLVNLSNIDYVYTADPRKDPSAEKIERTSWPEFRALLPKEWDPGLSSPFDPIAAKEAEATGLEVAVINGAKLEELENYISGKPFVGTVIS